MTDAPSLGNDDISNSTRRALLEYNPLLNKDGSRKQDVKLTQLRTRFSLTNHSQSVAASQ